MTDLFPPQNIDSERAVLGSCMSDEKALGEVRQILNHDNFYKRSHQLIYKAIEEMPLDEPVDRLTIHKQLQRMDVLEKVGGAYYIGGLIDGNHSPVNAKHYAKHVKEAYIARSGIEKYSAVAKALHGEGCDVEKEIGGVLAETFDLYKEIQGSDSEGMTGIALARSFANDFDVWQAEGDKGGLKSNLYDLDFLLNGFKEKQFIIIAGRPGSGKSALANTLLRNMSVRGNVVSALFNMEMGNKEITNRLIAAESGVSGRQMHVKKGLSEDEIGRVMNATAKVSESKIFVFDKAVQTAQSIHAKCRELVAQEGLQIVFVDYLQLMDGQGDSPNDVVSSISRGLKMIAMDLDIPVVALSQLSRAGATNTPGLKHLRDSGSLEQDTDIVMFVIDDEGHKIDLAKQRNGPVGNFQVIFKPEQTVFENKARDTPY